MSARPFEPQPDGTIRVTLSPPEAEAIGRIAQDLIEELGEPDDADLVRLFPPAYEDDLELQAEFESLTREDLERRKVAAAQAVLSSLKEGARSRGLWSTVLDADTQRAWLGVLNDARLVLGTRLQVTEESYEGRLPRRHPNAAAMDLYMYLGALEEILVEALLESEFGNRGDQE